MFSFLFSHADNILGAESYRAVFGYVAGSIRVVRDSGVKKALVPLRNIALEILVYGVPAPVIAVPVAVPGGILPVPQIECIRPVAGFARGNANNALFFTVLPLSLICSAAQMQHTDTIARRRRTCQETAERRRSAAEFAAKGLYLYIEFPQGIRMFGVTNAAQVYPNATRSTVREPCITVRESRILPRITFDKGVRRQPSTVVCAARSVALFTGFAVTRAANPAERL